MTQNTHHYSTHAAEIDQRNNSLKVYVNGEIVDRHNATVSVYDAGFMLGDGIWEGIRLYNGEWAFLGEHLDRLFGASKALDMDLKLDRAGFEQALNDTANANNMTSNVHARLMVTRGIKDKPFQDPRLSTTGPTIVIIMEHSKPVTDLIDRSIILHTVPVVRGVPMSQDPKLNSHSKLNCILAGIHAQKAGADEALMLDPHGFVNTTNGCNFFIVKKDELWTSTGDYCMNGITRKKVIELCKANSIPVFERNFSLTDTYDADEAFLTGTFGAQTSVKEIDGRSIGSGGAGTMTLKIRQLYFNLLEQETKR